MSGATVFESLKIEKIGIAEGEFGRELVLVPQLFEFHLRQRCGFLGKGRALMERPTDFFAQRAATPVFQATHWRRGWDLNPR